jgi:UDP-3-O-[3-hydroxymyristoyl] glucosamine N-acyltransferase
VSKDAHSAICIDPSVIIASTARVLGEVTIDGGAVVHNFVAIYPNGRIAPNVEVFQQAVISKPPAGTPALAQQVP